MIVLFKLGMQMLWLRLIPNILIFANLIKQQHCNISYGLMLILLIRLAPPVIHLNFESYCLAFSQTNTIIYGVELFCYWLKISQSFQTARGCRQHHRLVARINRVLNINIFSSHKPSCWAESGAVTEMNLENKGRVHTADMYEMFDDVWNQE